MTNQTGRTTLKGTKGAANRKATSASSWKKSTVSGTLVTVPSGNTAMIRTPGMESFLTGGMIPNSLLPMIQDSMARGEGPSEDQLQSLLQDKEKLQQIIDLANAVCVECCVDPKVSPVPKDDAGQIIPLGDERRDDDILYVDEVDFNDKMFIFNAAVAGTQNLTQFRQEQSAHVVAVQSGQDVGSSS